VWYNTLGFLCVLCWIYLVVYFTLVFDEVCTPLYVKSTIWFNKVISNPLSHIKDTEWPKLYQCIVKQHLSIHPIIYNVLYIHTFKCCVFPKRKFQHKLLFLTCPLTPTHSALRQTVFISNVFWRHWWHELP